MLFSKIFQVITVFGLAVALPVEEKSPYSVKEAASIARTLVNRESLTQFNTVQQYGSFKDFPVSFVEYYGDCQDDGNPFLLLIDISTDFRNVELGSNLSLSIKVGDHQLKDSSDPKYPGSVVSSTMGSPRVLLTGKLVDATELYSGPELIKITACFLKRHRDASLWLPQSGAHSSHWWKFQVEGVYFIGGFGDRAYIGEIPVEEYQNAELLSEGLYSSRIAEMMSGLW